MTTPCDRKGCKRTAQVVPEILVPHQVGVPFDPASRHGVLIGMNLCRRCASQFDARALVSGPAFIEFVRNAAKKIALLTRRPYQEPDFACARVELVKIGSDKHRRLARALTG